MTRDKRKKTAIARLAHNVEVAIALRTNITPDMIELIYETLNAAYEMGRQAPRDSQKSAVG